MVVDAWGFNIIFVGLVWVSCIACVYMAMVLLGHLFLFVIVLHVHLGMCLCCSVELVFALTLPLNGVSVAGDDAGHDSNVNRQLLCEW